MKKIYAIAMIAFFIGTLGCGNQPQPQPKTPLLNFGSGNQDKKIIQEKAKYFVNKAQALYASQRFQEAIQTAQYVVAQLDKNSAEAKKIIEDATVQIEVKAKEAASSVKKKIGQ